MNNDLSTFFGGTPFTPATVEPQADIDVYAPGKYPVLIEAAEVKQTKAGNGHYIGLTLQILDGPHKGRKLFDNINIDNPSAQCVEIGMRVFSALGRALGLQAVTDTDQLLGGIVVAHVKAKDGQNNVRTYSASGQQAIALAPAHPSGVPPMGPPETYAPPQVPIQQAPPGLPITPPTPVASPVQQETSQKPPWER